MSQGAIVNPTRAIPRFRLNNVTPFTYRDGLTYLELLEELRDHISSVVEQNNLNIDELNEFLDEQESWLTSNVGELTQQITTAIAELTALSGDAQQAADDVAAIFQELQTNGPVVSINGQHGIVEIPMVLQNQLTVNVKDFGATGDGESDDTAAIQAALDYASGNGTVTIPAGVYMIDADAGASVYNDAGGISVPSNSVITFHAGAILRALPVNDTVSKVVRLQNVDNVRISGPGIIDGNRDNALVSTGEWGHGIAIQAGSNISISDVSAINCWGDGINLQRLGHTDSTAPTNIHIRNVICDNNRRQGLSVIAGESVLIESSTFSRTNGTNPASGIDIEPSDGNGYVRGCWIRNCVFKENDRRGVEVYGEGIIEGVVVDSCVFDGNGVNDTVSQLQVRTQSAGFTLTNSTFINTRNEFAVEVGVLKGATIENNSLDASFRMRPTYSNSYNHGAHIAHNRVRGTMFLHIIADSRIEGNTIVSETGNAIDLSTGAACRNLIISGNTLTGEVGIYGHRSSPMINSTIDRNTFLETRGEAIDLVGGQRITISGNIFEGCCLNSGEAIIAAQSALAHWFIIENVVIVAPRTAEATNTPTYVFTGQNAIQRSRFRDNMIEGALSHFPASLNLDNGTSVFHGFRQSITTGTTEERPTTYATGEPYFDTSLNQPIWRSVGSSGWVGADGQPV